MCGQMADGDNCPLLLWISHLYPIQKHTYKDVSVDIDGAWNRAHAFLHLPIMSLNVSIFFLCKWSTTLEPLLSLLQWLCNYQASKNSAAGPLWREHWLQYLHELKEERAPCAEMDVSVVFFNQMCACAFGVYVENVRVWEREKENKKPGERKGRIKTQLIWMSPGRDHLVQGQQTAKLQLH